jgi:hypothetical protein
VVLSVVTLLMIGFAVGVAPFKNVVGAYSLRSLQVVPAAQLALLSESQLVGVASNAPPLQKAIVFVPVSVLYRATALAIVRRGAAGSVPVLLLSPGTQLASLPVPQSQ